MPEGKKRTPSRARTSKYESPLRRADFEKDRHHFHHGKYEYGATFYKIDERHQKELTKLMATDPVAVEVLIGCALGCAHSMYAKWMETATETGAFDLDDVISHCSEIIHDAFEDFDPGKSENFVTHAIGRVKVRFQDWANVQIHERTTGKTYAASTLQRAKRDDPRLGDATREDIALGGFFVTSLNAPVDIAGENESTDLNEVTPNDLGDPDERIINTDGLAEKRAMVASFNLTFDEWKCLEKYLGLNDDMPLSLNETGRQMCMARNTAKANLSRAAGKMGITFDDLEAEHQRVFQERSS